MVSSGTLMIDCYYTEPCKAKPWSAREHRLSERVQSETARIGIEPQSCGAHAGILQHQPDLIAQKGLSDGSGGPDASVRCLSKIVDMNVQSQYHCIAQQSPHGKL